MAFTVTPNELPSVKQICKKSRMPLWHTGFLFYSPIVVTGYFFSTFTVVPSALRTMYTPFEFIEPTLRPSKV